MRGTDYRAAVRDIEKLIANGSEKLSFTDELPASFKRVPSMSVAINLIIAPPVNGKMESML